MNWITVTVIVLVMALAVGPVMLAMPTRRQGYLAKLRARGQQLGFYIQLSKLALPGQDQDERVAAYRLGWPQKIRCDAWRLLRATYQHDLHFCGDWVWDGPEPALPAAVGAWLQSHLLGLGPDLRGLAIDVNGVAVYWQEKGGVEALERLYTLVDELRQLYVSVSPPLR